MDRRTRSLGLGIGFTALAVVAWSLCWALDLTTTRVALKPFPALLLAGLLAEAPPSRGRGLLRLGLLAMAAGDLLLELPGDSLVLSVWPYGAGLVLFTAALVGVERRALPVRLLPPLGLAGLMAVLLWSPMGAQRGPLLGYAALVALMWWRALCTWERPAGRLLCAAASLVALSDTLLGIDRFLLPLPAGRLLAVSTFWAALALFATAAFRGMSGDRPA